MNIARARGLAEALLEHNEVVAEVGRQILVALEGSPSERQLKLAQALDATADHWDKTMTLLSEHLTGASQAILDGERNLLVHMRETAERIRAGEYQ